jgi:sentrin-specific protease 7
MINLMKGNNSFYQCFPLYKYEIILFNSNNSQDNLIKKLFIYPPGRGGISITIHDYLCLGSDQYLNDVIIDFYLKYIEKELITNEQRNRVHIFSQFFYKRLTTMTREKDVKLTAAEKRWKRVSAWTKQVNIFEKDFIIVPINEQSHWFLAIICFPSLKEPHTMETNQPIKLIPMSKKKSKFI